MGKRTLKGLLLQFILAEFIFSISIVGLIFIGGTLALNSGFIHPANYPEMILGDVEKQIKKNSVALEDIPDIYQVQIEDKSGKVLSTTISDEEQKYVKEAQKNGIARGNKSFVFIEGKEQNVVLSYRLLSDFSSPTLRRLLPNAERLSYGIAVLLWVVGFLLIIRYFARRIQNELAKVMQINEEIRKMNLDFEVPQSRIYEINQLINSLDTLKNELSSSLQQQWDVKHQQEKTLQALTHDIRTPVTLIEGNLELLGETELSEEQSDLIVHTEKGIARLRKYIEELKMVSGLQRLATASKEPFSSDFIQQLVNLAESLAASKNIHIEVLHNESAKLLVHQAHLEEAFQNVVENAVTYSPIGSKIYLSFKHIAENYQIIVQDSGEGFTEESIKRGMDRFYTSSTERGCGHYGLGLAITAETVKQNGGRVELDNAVEGGRVAGGVVRLVF